MQETKDLETRNKDEVNDRSILEISMEDNVQDMPAEEKAETLEHESADPAEEDQDQQRENQDSQNEKDENNDTDEKDAEDE